MNLINSLSVFLTGLFFLIMNNVIHANVDGKGDFKVAGSMGLMKFVIIPTEKRDNIEYHRKIVKILCDQRQSCFINFFTNSHNAPEKLPLDDRILAEPTLMYKYSPKHRNEIEDWSCRLNLPIKSCFWKTFLNFEQWVPSQRLHSPSPTRRLWVYLVR